MRLRPLLDVQLPDELQERVRRSHAEALRELQDIVRAGQPRVVGGRWELVRREEVTVARAEVTFTGLNGDADREYLIRGLLVDAHASSSTYQLRINGGAGTRSHRLVSSGTSVSAANVASQIQIATGTTDTDLVARFEGVLLAKTGSWRMYSGRTGTHRAATEPVIQDLFEGVWTDSTTLITSLGVLRTSNTMAAGSWVELWRRAR
jgi:hypothetical protein